MAYGREIYDKVMAQLERLRQEALFRRSHRLQEVYTVCPKLKQIDSELEQTGAAASRMILSRPSDANKVLAQLQEQISTLAQLRSQTLVEAGFPADYTDLKFTCPKCDDTGYIKNKQCECLKKRLIEESCRASSLYNLFETQNFSSFDFSLYDSEIDEKEGTSPLERIKDIYKICEEFATQFDSVSDSLLFYGGAGLGKTFLSSAIAKELISQGRTVVYQSAVKLFSLYTDYTFGRVSPEQAKPQLDRLFDCDLLIIDDLGTEPVSTYSTSFLFEVLNSRILENKKMIISTNLNINELASIYSERLHSRLLEHFLPLKFIGNDIRLKKMINTNPKD